MKQRLTLVLTLVASSLTTFAETPFEKLANGRPVLCVNGDNDHYFKANCMSRFLPMEERWCAAGARKYLDIVTAGNKVTHLFMCPVGQRADWDAKSCDPIWLAIDEAKARGLEPDEWPVNAKKCFDNGVDVYRVWCQYAREKKNVSLWISMRMNDVHHVDRPWNMRTNRFWYEHPELHRRPHEKGSWTKHALDYAKPEVREFEFGIFKEIVDRYDADGYELDWMRFWEHLTPGREPELAYVLTDFMRRCRAYAKSKEKERGHPIYLSTRVPTSAAAAHDFGFDPETWAKEGLVEMIAIANFWAADDFDFDFAGWKRRLKTANPNVAVLAAACDNVSAGPGLGVFGANLETWRGWADNAYAAGSEGVYFFNVAYKSDNIQKTVYEKGFSPEDCAALPRRYIVSYHDCTKTRSQAECQLPLLCDQDQAVRVNVGSRVSPNARVWVTVAFDGECACPPVELNGQAPTGVPKADRHVGRYGKAKQAWMIPFSPTAVRQGRNDVRVCVPSKQTAGLKLVWAEIAVDWRR